MAKSARHETGFGFRNRREDLGKLTREECNLAYKKPPWQINSTNPARCGLLLAKQS